MGIYHFHKFPKTHGMSGTQPLQKHDRSGEHSIIHINGNDASRVLCTQGKSSLAHHHWHMDYALIP